MSSPHIASHEICYTPKSECYQNLFYFSPQTKLGIFLNPIPNDLFVVTVFIGGGVKCVTHGVFEAKVLLFGETSIFDFGYLFFCEKWILDMFNQIHFRKKPNFGKITDKADLSKSRSIVFMSGIPWF